MTIPPSGVRIISRLARISVTDSEASDISDQLNKILDFVDQLNEVDIEGVPPMTSVVDVSMRLRSDIVDDGDKVAEVTKNAPVIEDNFFVVPKVVE